MQTSTISQSFISGMALMWRLSARRAGRRVLAGLGGFSLLWIVLILLLPTVLPPSQSTGNHALPPAHRRIHQQAEADYTGQKSGDHQKLDKGESFSGEDLRKSRTPGYSTKGGATDAEVGFSNDSVKSNMVDSTERRNLDESIHKLNRDAYLKSKLLEEQEKKIISGVPSENAVLKYKKRDMFAPIQTPARVKSSNVLLNAKVVPLDVENNNFAMDQIEELGRAAGGYLLAQNVNQENNAAVENIETIIPKLDINNTDEGPYTLPILKAPKDGIKTHKVNYHFDFRVIFYLIQDTMSQYDCDVENFLVENLFILKRELYENLFLHNNCHLFGLFLSKFRYI